MESSPWKLIDKSLKAIKVVTAEIDFSLEDSGTSLPDSPKDSEIFTLIDSLTAPSYMWEFRYNPASISYHWELIGGTPAIIFTTNVNAHLSELTKIDAKNEFEDSVYYLSGNTFSLPYKGEYEFTGGVVIENPIMKDVRVSTQMLFNKFGQIGPTWPQVLKPGFNYVPLPLKRITGCNPGKIALGIGSPNPQDIVIHWGTCIIRPVKIQ